VERPLLGSTKVKVSPFMGMKGQVPKLRLTCLGVSVEINTAHYDKLRLLYAKAAGPQVKHDAAAFTRAAMALLLRYSSAQGTHYRGGGFQVRGLRAAVWLLPCGHEAHRTALSGQEGVFLHRH
jgi:hypothetical protein